MLAMLLAAAVAHDARASFHRFSDQLYCSGAAERQCVLPGSAAQHSTNPGECLWLSPANVPVTPESMQSVGRSGWVLDHWDASSAVGPSMRTFDRAAAAGRAEGLELPSPGPSHNP